MDITKVLERRAKKWPGIVQVVSLLAIVMALYFGKDRMTRWNNVFVFVLAILLYTLGSTLDGIVFDPLYGLRPSGKLKRVWRLVAWAIFFPVKFVVDKLPGTRELAVYRKAATEELRGRVAGARFSVIKEEDCQGIYSAAKTLLEGTEEWEDHVKPWLEMSKAIRSFVYPLTAVLAYDLVHGRLSFSWLEASLSTWILNLLERWGVWFAALMLALVLYVWLRAFHMRAMYKLVTNSQYIAYPTRAECEGEYRTVIPARYLDIGEPAGDKTDRRLPVFLLVAK